MRSSVGQSIVEQLALLAIVATAASALALVTVRSGVVPELARAVVGDRSDAPPVSPELTALVARALDGDPGAPTVDDAVALVGTELPDDAARRFVARLAYARAAPAALAARRPDVQVDPRGPGVATIVTAADEERLTAAELAARRSRQDRQLLALAGEVVVSVVTESYLVAVAATITGRALAGPSPRTGRSLAPGTQAGDVVLCLPVTWRSLRPAGRFSAPPARAGARLDATEQASRSYPATLLVIERGGRTLTSAAFAGDGCRVA